MQIEDSLAVELSLWEESTCFEANDAEMELAAKVSNKQINRAGDVLASGDSSEGDRVAAFEIVNKWRASYSLPLRAVASLVRQAAVRYNRFALVSRRLKRMESIVVKLRRPEMKNMGLTTMQDIGGCRVVFWTLTEVVLLSRKFQDFDNSAYRVDRYDYIESPKPDGYRGRHFVVRYQSNNPKYADWNGRRIEIQIRTALQHAWATALETVDMFSKQTMKTGGGNPRWRRFFALASSAFACRENSPLVPDTPTDLLDLTEELRGLWKELKVPGLLLAWATAMQNLPRLLNDPSVPMSEASIFLVTVDLAAKNINLHGFHNESVAQANEKYAEVEEEIRQGRDAYTVLVAVDRAKELGQAFPNLYADTREFLREVGGFLNESYDA